MGERSRSWLVKWECSLVGGCSGVEGYGSGIEFIAGEGEAGRKVWSRSSQAGARCDVLLRVGSGFAKPAGNDTSTPLRSSGGLITCPLFVTPIHHLLRPHAFASDPLTREHTRSIPAGFRGSDHAGSMATTWEDVLRPLLTKLEPANPETNNAWPPIPFLSLSLSSVYWLE